MDDGNEQQYQAEVMAELARKEFEADAEYLAWLDRMYNLQECEQ